jgi:2-methylcitrate dehydratase
VEVEYPIGHRRRRKDAVPLLREKFQTALATRFSAKRVSHIQQAFSDPAKLDAMTVDELLNAFAAEER